MREKLFLLLVIFFILIVTFTSACTSNSRYSQNSYEKNTIVPTPTPVPTPEDIFEKYYYGYVYLDEDKIWDVLSENVKSKKDKNGIYNTLYALYSQGAIPSSYEINNMQIGENDATLYISVNSIIQGYKITHDKEIPLVRENGDWKIDEFVVLL